MELLLQRQVQLDDGVLGELFLDGQHEAWTVEPPEVGEDHPAIPIGRYPVTINYSPRFHRPLPLVYNVPDRSGIRFHPGNTDDDTDGCIVIGQQRTADGVAASRVAMQAFQPKVQAALVAHQEVWLTVEEAHGLTGVVS